jgi:CheY-like chemotaxis protein
VIRRQLAHCGATVVEAADGNLVLKELERHYNQHHRGFDFVLLDMDLRGMDSKDVAWAITQDNRYKDTRLVSMAVVGGLDDSYLELGFLAYIHKLVVPTDLFQAMETACESQIIKPEDVVEIAGAELIETPGVIAGSRVLLVEDNEINQVVALGIRF